MTPSVGDDITICGVFYTLLMFLGGGSYGRVFLARIGHRKVVVKLFEDEGECREEVNATDFTEEVNRLEKAKGRENIFPIMEVYDIPGRAIVYEWVQGVTLKEYTLRTNGCIGINVVEMLTRLLAMLETLASHDLVHRDIKPDNIMVGYDGRIFLVDVGLIVRRGVHDDDRRYARWWRSIQASLCSMMRSRYRPPTSDTDEVFALIATFALLYFPDAFWGILCSRDDPDHIDRLKGAMSEDQWKLVRESMHKRRIHIPPSVENHPCLGTLDLVCAQLRKEQAGNPAALVMIEVVQLLFVPLTAQELLDRVQRLKAKYMRPSFLDVLMRGMFTH